MPRKVVLGGMGSSGWTNPHDLDPMVVKAEAISDHPLKPLDKAAAMHTLHVMQHKELTGLEYPNMTSFKDGARWAMEEKKSTTTKRTMDMQQSADEYVRNQKPCVQDYGFTLYNGDQMTNAFEAGAQWQREHVWHDAKEKPRKGAYIVALKGSGKPLAGEFDSSKTNSGNGLTAFTIVVNRQDGKADMKITCIEKWAYLEDLMTEEESIN